MRTIRELGPLAVVVGVVSAITLYLLGANPLLGPWILAALLFAHGWVHLMFVFPRPPASAAAAPAPAAAAQAPARARAGASTGAGAGAPAVPMAWPFDLGASWLIGRSGVSPGAVRAIGRALVAIVFIGFLLAALATAGVLVPAELWAGLVLVAAAFSALLLGIACSRTLLLGFAIDGAVAWLVLAGPWTPAGS